ncbi:MAG: DUF2490 domain-containing protein [Chloroherpetonaceae bacterium]
MKRIGVIFLIFFSLSANAQPIDEHDVVSWTSAMLTLRFGETPYTVQTFAQTRFTQNVTRFQTTVFSVWGLYRVIPSTSIGFGYTILTPINNRVLDILSVQLWHDTRINEMPLSLRFRAENLTWRSPDDFFVEIISALRFRFRLEITVPLWNNYGLLLNNEIFWGVSEPIFNQNRAQIGIRYREGGVIIDTIYQHRFINRIKGLPDRIEHTLLLNFFYTIRL